MALFSAILLKELCWWHSMIVTYESMGGHLQSKWKVIENWLRCYFSCLWHVFLKMGKQPSFILQTFRKMMNWWISFWFNVMWQFQNASGVKLVSLNWQLYSKFIYYLCLFHILVWPNSILKLLHHIETKTSPSTGHNFIMTKRNNFVLNSVIKCLWYEIIGNFSFMSVWRQYPPLFS